MNYKKIFFSVLIVALAATMSVGFTSCNDDIKKEGPKPDYSGRLIGKWKCIPWGLAGYFIDFKDDGTYSYENPEQGSGAGKYRVIETVLDQEVKFGDLDVKTALLVIEVSPNDVFDRIQVYYYPSQIPQISVKYYSRGQLLTDSSYVLHLYW